MRSFAVDGLIVIGILVAFVAGIFVLGRESQRDAELRQCLDRRQLVDDHVKALIRAVRENDAGTENK